MTNELRNEQAIRELKAMREHIEPYMSIVGLTAYDMAINALEQQPCDAISREEAIRIAEQGQIQGYEWQFKKLCNLPSVTPSYNSVKTELKPCEDFISREAVKNMLTVEWTKYMPMESDVNLSFVLGKISELPSVTPKTKTGKWIEYCYQNFSCSDCGYIVADTDINEYKYCPKCGARMEVNK